MPLTVLITGCSTGIGAAMARDLHARGHVVYATARKPEALAGLADLGLKTLTLDVNDDASIAAAMAQVEEQSGHLDILVNNAGFSQVGAVLDLKREDLRAQYETNVIAPIAVTRAALPLLRAAKAKNGAAQVTMIGSIVGLFTTPFAGAYCSSKAAIHSLTDALRMELVPFGVDVVTVQPGGILSSFGDNAEANMQLPEDSLYKGVEESVRARAQAGQVGATPADEFVPPVIDSMLKGSPHPVVRGGRGSTSLPLLKRWMPLKIFDGLMVKRFGLDKFSPPAA